MKKVLKIICIVFLFIVIGTIAYLESGHYNPDMAASAYPYTDINDDYITYDNNSSIGFIFYPGAKVDSEAYSYLSSINANLYVAEFPFEMAMFGYKVADQIISDNPQITTWYIGGHSLGGVFANRYAVTTEQDIAGIVFLGSYPAEGDQSDIPGLALFGDQDLVVGDYTEKLSNFTACDQIIVLENSNHSGFGNYGQQKGDSVLSNDERLTQQKLIVKDINEFIK